MKRSLRQFTGATPTITLLSSSPAAVQRAVDRLAEWTSLGGASTRTTTSAHHVIPWTVTTTKCRETGVAVRWLAPSLRSFPADSSPRHALLAIQSGDISSSNPMADDVATFLSLFDATLSRTKLRLSNWFRRPLLPRYLLGPSPAPLLHFIPPPGTSTSEEFGDALAEIAPAEASVRAGLKEVVVPLGGDDDDGVASFVSQLSSYPQVSRPAMGLYQLPGPSGMCVRPLPTGQHDRQLPPPSLIFHAPNSEDLFARSAPKQRGGERDPSEPVLRKIGHSGGRANVGGQYRLESTDLHGLDVRLCSSHQYSSMFAEAHESLLAGSLDDLQSSLVLRKGAQTPSSLTANQPSGDASEAQGHNQGDCWVEFRATMRRPSGFFAKNPRQRTAGPPDLPYE